MPPLVAVIGSNRLRMGTVWLPMAMPSDDRT
jgi:hypothetical protein